MINTLVFDFGDVFINLDKKATANALNNFGITGISSQMQAVNEAYEVGNILTDDFLDYYQNLLPKITKKQLINAWNSIILNFPDYRLSFLQHIKKQNDYTLILLSNTNELHIQKVIEIMGNNKYQAFKNCFDGFYLSHQIGLRKPTPEIFNFITEKHHLTPENCLFIDDTKEHIETAKKLKFKTWHLNPKNEDVIKLIETQKKYFKR